MKNNKEESIVIDDDDDDLIDDSMLAEFETSGPKDFNSKEQTSNVNRSIDLDTSDLNVSALCCDEEFSGFDKLTGTKWIYPSNYPVRDYQFNIIRSAIFKNTLVSLPTGLGKTFIAAVLMYNFYRWYPLGKIVFTAPTKPLIAQQIDACYHIIGLPPDDTIEMTGNMNINLRKENWAKKRVFFATPQVVSNDIKSGICPGKKIRCLVIDEAHKAKSNYAYCHIVSTLTEMDHKTYRILALSATPGSRINDVVQVVKNLHIAHLELRTEDCIDVAPYCFNRNIKTVVVPLGPELEALRKKYIEILDSYARKLVQLNILKSSLGNISKGRILMIYKEFQMNSRSHPQRSHIMHDLSRLISLYHALELLVSHGSRSFLNFFDEHSDKTWIQSDVRITELLEELRAQLGVNPLTLDTSELPDGTRPQIPKNLCFGHPKFTKVKEIMVDHFKRAKDKNIDTRAIVFCEYHETVKLVECLLLQCSPLINPRVFVGQGASGKGGRCAMPQRRQLEVMRQFRAGGCNALVATCVAEEGLDVGAVDLILCFDVATRSPVRLVQRCGRTGRERTGQVYFLVTEGKEHQTLMEGMKQRDTLKTQILQSKEVKESLYSLNQRLIPYDITPKCEKMYITASKRATSSGKSLQQWKDKKKPQKQSAPSEEPLTSPIKKQNQVLTAFLSPKKEDSKMSIQPSISPKVSPMKIKKEKSKQPLAKPTKKNADIRALFIAANKCKPDGVKIANELLSNNEQMSTQSLDLYFDLAMEAKTVNTCYICTNGCDCRNILKLKRGVKENYRGLLKYDSTLPDINLLDDFSAESILESSITIVHERYEDDIHKYSFLPSQSNGLDVEDSWVKKELEELKTIEDSNIIEEFKTIHSEIKEESKMIEELEMIEELKNIEESKTIESKSIPESKTIQESNTTKEGKTIESNFDIGDVDDIFVLSPREEEAYKVNETKVEQFKIPSINFDLGSFDDIEVNFDNKNEVDQTQKPKECDENNRLDNDTCIIDLSRDESPEPVKPVAPLPQKSPSILSGSRQSTTKSPILTSQSRKLKLKRKPLNVSGPNAVNAHKQLNVETEHANLSSSMSVTQILSMINSCDDSQPITKQDEDEGRLSPIILTQADKKKKLLNNSTNISNNKTQLDVEISIDRDSPSTSAHHKRKTDEEVSSPYFNKKPKLDNGTQNGLTGATTIKDKIFAVLTSNDINKEKRFSNDVINFNCTTFIPSTELKENLYSGNPIKKENDFYNLFDKFSYTPKKEVGIKQTMESEPKQKLNGKISKRKKAHNSFIDSEAELSDELEGSADELTDDSAGSIVDFITDEHVSPSKEMHAIYLKSVKSPINNGAFKIPQLPPNYKNTIVHSQFEEQDSYEMDSFCVDSHVGLTQVNELSSLDLAEIILEEERKRKKKCRSAKGIAREQDDSPVVKRRANAKRRVISDSEDSS